MSTCLTCSKAAMTAPRDTKRNEVLKAMVANGAINCTASAFAASFHRFDHKCPQWAAAPAKAVAARQQVLQRMRESP